ncbi:MAG: error-prone DNA polymerase [Proteobacteria bacterium]|nr:error-prone DNA polymerase [Pseudomonadota bacterium]
MESSVEPGPGRFPGYAELHCLSNFTFLRGASHPREQVERAAELGYAALALTDECSLAGVVRAHTAAKEQSLKLIIGSEFRLEGGIETVVLAPNRAAYGALSTLISQARRAAEKGAYRLTMEDFEHYLAPSECLVLWLPKKLPEELPGASPGVAADLREGAWLKERFSRRLWLAAELLMTGRDRALLARWRHVAAKLGLPMLASGNVHMHCRERRRLQDTLTAIRLGQPLQKMGFGLYSNGERFLRPIGELARIYPRRLLMETLAVAERIDFSMDELRYEYPRELVPEGATPAGHLRDLTGEGMRWRWPQGAPARVRELVDYELELIGELRYEAYFLTVHDIVRFARDRGILCQGRGSAANSAVCYCLGITEVDPARMQVLMERFISRERNEPPDIDVDFEHERREEVIQYIYRKYSRERAALAATVITYRTRSAVRDVGKALGMEEAQVGVLARSVQWWDGKEIAARQIGDAGFDPQAPVIRRLMGLVEDLVGFPRHLSQHVGGFVISEGPLSGLVPIENAAMEDRTVIQWDKDDLEDLGLLKVDVLGLGMLSAIRRSFELIRGFYGREYTMASLPAEDPAVYDMICEADTVGVFQIESRAQMVMLPRLRPRCYYDLVIEVAIVRPGPIQGDMVHPYLRRRNGEDPVTYPSPEVKRVLERTLGVPIFQEQVMQIAMVAAGFTPGEADRLRRAMAAWKRRGGLEGFESRLKAGMAERGYSPEFAERIFNQIKGFGDYGFPESHAASFALLAYVSAWLKCHEPAVFFCALLNSQPMGFYAPAQLVRCAREHGVEVRPVDVNCSDRESTLERDATGRPVLRLGLNRVKGLAEQAAGRVVNARCGNVRRGTPRLENVRRGDAQPGNVQLGIAFESVPELAERARLDSRALDVLAGAGALESLAGNRHRAHWDAAGVEKPTPLLGQARIAEGVPMLKAPTEGQEVLADYRHLGLSLRCHPLALLRDRLTSAGLQTACDVLQRPDGAAVHAAGLVIARQRPSTASGVIFVTIEDETGYLNLVVWERVAERQRQVLLGATLLGVHGEVQREGAVVHIVARQLSDHSGLLGELPARSRDFH